MMKTDMIIFSGQSNMQGQTERLPDDNAPVENALEYRLGGDRLIPLRHPVGEDIDTGGRVFEPDWAKQRETLARSALLSSWKGNANMVPAFCRTYAAQTGRRAVAVHAAKGSTVLADWMPGGASYAMLCRKAEGARRLAGPERAFFVWLQGESDAIIGTSKEAYKAGLIHLKDSLKADLGIERFGVILVGEFVGDARGRVIMDAQREACREDGDFLMLTTITETLTRDVRYMNPFVGGHFGCAGQELIGTEAGRALAAYARGL